MVRFIEPAVDYIRSHPVLQTAFGAKARSNLVAALLKDNNPCVALTAAQILTSEGQITPEDLDTVMESQDVVLIGAVVADSNVSYFRRSLGAAGCLSQKAIQSASPTQLRGIVFGAADAQYLFMSGLCIRRPATQGWRPRDNQSLRCPGPLCRVSLQIGVCSIRATKPADYR